MIDVPVDNKISKNFYPRACASEADSKRKETENIVTLDSTVYRQLFHLTSPRVRDNSG